MAEISQQAFDLSRSGDPVAGRTNWSPASDGGASFRTHELVRVNAGRMEFQPSVFARVFYLIFFIAGVGALLYSLFPGLSIGERLPALFCGLLFVGVGGGMHYLGTAPVVFDKQRGRFRKGRKSSLRLVKRFAPQQSAELIDIHALQLLSEYCRGSKTSFYSYEINLVLANGERINVVDHGSKTRIRSDARLLSLFLGKPVWDAIS